MDEKPVKPDRAEARPRTPPNHRTVDRVTEILELVVYTPGQTFAELARSLDAAKSSVYGFVQGLLARGWLYEQDRRLYLGPAAFGLVLASGQVPASTVSHDQLLALHEECGAAVFMGIPVGDHLIYVAEAGTEALTTFEARSNIRRTLLGTAGGKVLLAARPDTPLRAFLSRRRDGEPELVDAFLSQLDEIRRSGLALNWRLNGARFAIATVVFDQSGEAVASITIVGGASDLEPRRRKLGQMLLKHVSSWSRGGQAAQRAR